MDEYDIVVIGAGPAGSTAARLASDGGARVLLLDKRRELGTPVQCGGAVGEGVFKDLNIDEPNPRWIVNKVGAARLVSPSGISFTLKGGEEAGYILDRKIFDRDLAILAAHAGSEIYVSTFVDGLLIENGETKGVTARTPLGRAKFRAEIIIAADGVASQVARWTGIDTVLKPSEIESGIQFKMTGVEVPPSTMSFYFGNKIAPGGYAWVFPLDNDMASVGLGVLAKRTEKPPIEYLREFVNDRPELRSGKVFEVNGGGIPVSGPIDETVKGNLMVVGDAARQVNALTGGGIDWSMRAGKIAGEVAAKAAASDDVSRLFEYEKRWRKTLGDKLEKYRIGKEILSRLSDKELDQSAEFLQGSGLKRVSLTDILKALTEIHPELRKMIGEMS